MKMEIIVTSSDKHITEAFASIVVASGNRARQTTNFDQLIHLYKDSKADLALVDEYVNYKNKKTNIFEILGNLSNDFTFILAINDRINEESNNKIYYINKPIGLNVFEEAIRTFTYMKQKITTKIVKIGNISYDEYKRIIYTEDKKVIHLTGQENNLLKILVKNINKHISKKMLLEKTWGYSSSVDSKTIETHIWRLRKKLKINSRSKFFLKTVREGYCLVDDTN